MKIKTAVIDDEAADLHQIQAYLKSQTEFDCDYFCDALNIPESYDLYLLDIEMPKCNGFEFASKIKENHCDASIIFISQHDQFVFDSLKLSPVYFVRKSFFEQDLSIALDKIKHNYQQSHQTYTFEYDKSIMSIDIKDIYYFEVLKNTLILHTEKQILKQRKTLKAIQDEMDEKQFCQCHQSYMVNMSAIKQVNAETIVLKNNECIPISRRYRNHVRTKFLSYIKEQG